MAANGSPVVSVAIPLFRSKRFLPVIIRNIADLDYPNVEIIVSDRHSQDDCLDALRRRFDGDPRVLFVQASDGMDWIAHYNNLLERASGRYFMWMPHDDSFPSNYVSQLVAALEEDPEAVLAFGEIEPGDAQGTPLTNVVVSPPVFSSRPLFRSLQLLFWGPAIPFRGVFRRERVRRLGLDLRPTRGGMWADGAWVFGVSLAGPLRFVETCRCRKRFYPDSTSASFRPGLRELADASRVLLSYLKDFSPHPRERWMGTAGVLLWSIAWMAILTGARLPTPLKSQGRRIRQRLWRQGMERTGG